MTYQVRFVLPYMKSLSTDLRPHFSNLQVTRLRGMFESFFLSNMHSLVNTRR